MPTVQSSLLDNYARIPDGYDELVDADGQLRPRWNRFCQMLDGLGRQEFSRRWEQIQAQQSEHGMASGIGVKNQRDAARAWDLDALPLLIPAEEWDVVSAALDQRARLLNMILADLYGPQQLLTDALLPQEILFSHPDFRRPYHGYAPAGGRHLHIYAADLVRAPTGQWWILSDDTEAPAGLGHVLENRIVLSRMLPDIFHACQVERLAQYFIALRETLAAMAPGQNQNPRIALLSAGPESPSHFEDTYLARYLGYVLVQGSDLTVRHGRVMLKTLGGLVPVDVILRRTVSASCDPLELSSSGTGGPAGLMQALRAGNVAVGNAPGTGLVQSPIFQAFIPRLCEQLLGESLLIPNIATWWCGDPNSQKYVLDHLEELIIRPAFRQCRDGSRLPLDISQLESDELVTAITSSPHSYVAQERIARSTGPVWSSGQLSAAYMTLRTYATASADSYVVMQGALARTSMDPAPLEFSLLAGEGSKDTWITSKAPVSQVSLLRPQESGIRLRRSGAELPSRVAENLYWLGRYLERADAFARLLRTLAGRLAGEVSADAMPEAPALLRVLAKQGQIEPGFAVAGIRESLPEIGRALPTAALGDSQDGNLRATITSLYRTAWQVRDRLSLDSWRIIRRLESRLRYSSPDEETAINELSNLLDHLIANLAAFSGLVMESMTRSLGWLFLDLGRRMERAQQTTDLIAGTLEKQQDIPLQLLEAVLEAADSLMTYRSRYLADLQVAAVLDLLLADETNPRSVAYQLVTLSDHVEALPRDRTQPQLSDEQRFALTLLHDVRIADVTLLAELHRSGQGESLSRILQKIEQSLPKLSDAIYHRYLVHAGPPRQLSDLQPEVRS